MIRARGILVIISAMACAGCNPPAKPESAQPGLVMTLQHQIDDLTARDAELRERNDTLAGRVRRSEGANEQLRLQLEAVGDAPRQRDLYREQVELQYRQIDRLRAQVNQLSQRLGLAPPYQTTSAPAATVPDQPPSQPAK